VCGLVFASYAVHLIRNFSLLPFLNLGIYTSGFPKSTSLTRTPEPQRHTTKKIVINLNLRKVLLAKTMLLNQVRKKTHTV